MGCFNFSWLHASPSNGQPQLGANTPGGGGPARVADNSSSKSERSRSTTEKDTLDSPVHAAAEALKCLNAAAAAETAGLSPDVRLSFTFAHPTRSNSKQGDGEAKQKPGLAKHLVPKSFYFRDTKYRQRRHQTIEPRTQGKLLVRKVEMVVFGSWDDLYCTIREGSFLCYVPANISGTDYSGEPLHNLKLCGAHLMVDSNNTKNIRKFKIRTDDNMTYHFSAASHDEMQGWLQAFSSVPGLYRRAEDYFRVGSMIGKGATCRAFECSSRLTKKQFVLKIRANCHDMASTRGMHNELRILQKCAPFNHPAIPHLEDYFFDQDGKIAVIMERFYGGELYNKVMGHNDFTERQAHQVFRQVAGGVAFLHSQGIVHRDLKTSNMLIRNEEGPIDVALIDFDLAKMNYAPVWEGHTPCGTAPYMAPEIVRKSHRYSMAVDMWSLGCVLYVLLTGKRPFDGKDEEDIKAAITKRQFTLSHDELAEHISPLALDLILKLVQLKPEDRLTAGECLQHEWVMQDPSKVPDAPLPAPFNLRKKFTDAERKQLSSKDADQSYRARGKLSMLVESLAPPEGHPPTRPPSEEVERATKRSLDIEGLKVLLEKNDNLHSLADATRSPTAQTPQATAAEP